MTRKRRDETRRSKARQGKTRPGRTEHGNTRQYKARKDNARQNMTKQDIRSNFSSSRPSLTAYAWPRRNGRSEVLRAESMSGLDGNRESGAVFSPCTCCSYWGHFGITLPLVYLTKAPGVPHQGNGSHGRRATVLNSAGVRGQGGNREVGGGLRCWWADRLE